MIGGGDEAVILQGTTSTVQNSALNISLAKMG